MKSAYVVLALLCLVPNAWAQKNLDLESLRMEHDNFVTDEKYKPYAKAEKQAAREAIEEVYNSRRRRVKEQSVYLARNTLAVAKLQAEAEWLRDQLGQTTEQLRQLEIEILKAESTVSRYEADKMRLQLSLKEEEAERERQAKLRAQQLADQSQSQAEKARAEAEAAKRLAQLQAEEAALAKEEAALALEEADALRRQLESLAARETSQGLMMTLGDFVFDSASANIKQQAVDNFDRVLEFIDAYPERNIRIEGHTDASGSAEFNLNLSQQRADAVKALLLEYGLNAARIEAVGMGEDFPVADNNSEAGKSKNRRVEIIILKQ